MAVRVAIIVCATSFLLGILFTHWIADSLTLWKAAQLDGADARLWTAASYYRVLMSGDPRNAYVALGVATLGGISLVMSLHDGKAFNLMFDGGSTFLFATAGAMYSYHVLPILLQDISTLPSSPAKDTPFPSELRIPTMSLASSHLVCSVTLTGVILLQAARRWSEREDSGAPELAPSAGVEQKKVAESKPQAGKGKKAKAA
ncbi:hypothetical protein PENSPDRAFT_631465 [Peniophora sp. CONT]|nr:hypothetical protein PENSPDRAFT_631465 [Peniophora sp. CONT]